MTFVTRREEIVPEGSVGDYLAWNEHVSEVLLAEPGFQGYFTLNSLGQLDRYSRLVLWDSREAWRAATRTAAFESFVRDNPTADLFAETGSGRGYDVVLEVDGPRRAGVVNLNDFIVDVDGAVPAFIESSPGVLGGRQGRRPAVLEASASS